MTRMEFNRNNGLFVYYTFFKDYVDGQDKKNTDFDNRITFNKNYLDSLNSTLYNQGVKINNLEAHINTLEQTLSSLSTRVTALENKGGTTQ